MNSSTVTLTDGQGNTVAANVTFDAGTNTATLTPSSPLAVSTTYTLTVSGGAGGVADADGGTLASDFTSSFSTAALSVIGVTPTDGSADQSVNTSVMVEFNSDMNAATLDSSTVTLTDGQGNAVAATVTYDAGSRTATLTPNAPLSN